MRTFISLSGALAVALSPVSAWAQDVPVPDTSVQDAAIKDAAIQTITDDAAGAKEQREAIVSSPAADGGPSLPRERIALQASTDDNSAILTLTPAQPFFDGGTDIGLSFTVKAPLDTATKQGTFVTHNGLSNGFSAGFSFNIVSTDFGPTFDERKWLIKMGDECRAEAAARLKIPLPVRSTEDQEKLELVCPAHKGVRELTDEYLLERVKEGKLSLESYQAIMSYRQRIYNARLLLLNISGSVGHKAFDPLSDVDFSIRHAERTPYAFAISGGLRPRKGNVFFAVGYQLRSDYKDAPKRVVCPAAAPPPATTACKYEIFDLPTPTVDHAVFGLIRIGGPFARTGKGPMIELKVAYDFEDRVFGAEMPVYFFADKELGLRGGLRLSWEERGDDPDKDNFKLGIFVVKTFDPYSL